MTKNCSKTVFIREQFCHQFGPLLARLSLSKDLICGALTKVRFLFLQLTESQIDAEAPNSKGRNPLHILSSFGQENSVAIFELFLECMPGYPINRPDVEGSTRKLDIELRHYRVVEPGLIA